MSEKKADAGMEVSGAVKQTPVNQADKKKARGTSLMYLGPTVTGAARHGTVFKNGVLPQKAQECIAKLPQMKRLFVEVEKVPGAVRELKKQQSVLGAVYSQVEAFFNTQKE